MKRRKHLSWAAGFLIILTATSLSDNLRAQVKPRKRGTENPAKNQVIIRLPPAKVIDSPLQIKNGRFFDGAALIGQSPSQAEKMLGRAVEVEAHEITAEQLAQPGRHVFDEIRHYKVNGEKFINYTLYGLRVRFLKNKAVGFDLDLPAPQKTPEAALALVGIDVTGKPNYLRSSATAKFWRDDFDGKRLTVAATMYVSEANLYNLVEVRLYQNDEL